MSIESGRLRFCIQAIMRRCDNDEDFAIEFNKYLKEQDKSYVGDLTPEQIYEWSVVKYLDGGKAIPSLARFLMVSKRVIADWRDQEPLFAEALERGGDYGDGFLYDKLLDNLENKDFSVKGLAYYIELKRPKPVPSGMNGRIEINFKDISDEQLSLFAESSEDEPTTAN